MQNQRRTWFITGCSRGIGFEMVRQLLEKDQRVHAVTRSTATGDLESLLIKHPDTLDIHRLDFSKAESIQKISQSFATVKVDILVNNAGTNLHWDEEFSKLDLNKVQEIFRINTLMPMAVSQALLPSLRLGSDPKIINITSLMGSIADNASGGAYGYRMSKTALNMFTKSFSRDHPRFTTLCLHPGWVQTAMGGADAPTSVQESVKGLLLRIEAATPLDSGKFMDFEGEELPW